MPTWLAFLLSCLTTPCFNLLWMRQALTAGLQPTDPDCSQCCEQHCPATSCPQGTYFSSGLCTECPPGHFCPGNMSAPRRCPPGTYNYYPGKSALDDCQPCPSGSISTEDGTGCKPCPAGASCDWLTGAVTLCPPGQHSPEGHTHCLACSPGFVCADGYQRLCQPGEEPNSKQTQCHPCLAGSYSTNSHCYLCPTGTYCPHPGTVLPLPCPPGQYSDRLGQRQCLHCNETSHCGGAPLFPWPKPGAHLVQRSRVPTTCPPGTYGNRDEGPGCLLCSPGHYCTGGAAIQCPAGTYGPKDGLQRESDCVPCPAGFYCLEGSPKRPGSQFMCPQGYYCEDGTSTPHGTPCPAGTAGSQLGQTSKAACKRCAEGRYCPAGSVFPGLPCARGRFCPAGTMEEVSCPKGTFTPHQGAASVKDCLKCPPGFYCPEGTSDPMPCQPGTFNPLEGQDEAADCRACYPGKACTQAGLKAPDVDCLQGFSCPPGSSRPNTPANACPPGTMSERTDLADRSQCQPCPPRYACPRGTGGAQRPALSCFAGHYCPPGTMFPTQHKCPAGTWSQRSGLESEGECGPCPRGWYCLAGAGAPSGRCSSGHYCPEGTQYGSQFPCPAGTYSTRVGNAAREDCLFCTEGAYCPPGSSKPTPCPPTTFRREKGGQRPEDCNVCPAGYFCPLSGTVRPSPCGAGSYSGEGSASCLPCQRGHYCSSIATSREAMLSQMVCPAGLHCSQGLDREPQRSATLCPKGFYCPGGSIEPNPIPCPNGTYSSQPGLRELKECMPCPAGLFCFSQQPWERPLTEPTGSCPDGYYCPVGTGEPRSHPCPAGVFRNHSQGHRGELCVPCPPGHYCGSLATHTPAVCPQGFFCTKGSSAPTPCEEGTYGDRPALQNAFECTPCGWGKYCSGVGRTEPSGVCEEGFYCRGRARSATPAGGLCPTGSFCPPGSALPSGCPPGTFSNNTGLGNALQCVQCPPGFYCSGSNNTSPTGPCSPGYYCTGASVSPVQYEAEEGHFTQAGASRAESCPFGTFQPARGQGSCLECPRGHLCNQTGLARPPFCPPGHFCPAGSMLSHPCPPGSYLGQVGGESVQHCGPCDAGMFCRNPGLLAPQGPCRPGFYCLGGASTATPVNSSSGDVCPVGYFCPSGTRHPRENPCPPGTWSNAVGARDSSSCWLCPAGFFCNGSALIQPSGLCAPGFYCSGGAKSARPVDGITGNRCPVGYHCPQGSTSPVNCQDGSYSNTTGAAECLDCPPGTYCPSGVGVQPCPAGHYCQGGTGAEEVLPCPPGTFSPESGRSQLEQCQLCPAGMYCEDWGQTEPTGPCQAGHFCRAGINFPNPDGNISTGVGGPCPQGHYCPAGTSLPVPCPLGHFSESLHLTERSDCSLCPPGWFCGSVGLVRPSGPCREGFYCPGGDFLSTGHGAGEEPEIGVEPGPSPGVCPLAHYCPFGSAAPLPCPAGSYINLSSQAHCSRCPAGYYCPERTSNYSRFPCPPGFYCPDGTRYATQFPCPRGYYNPEPMTQSLDSCLPCPPGHYCEKERLTAVSGKCKAGWFCVSAAWNSQPFDLDNYTNANCLCPATSTGGKCQKGFYCPSGSSEPYPCPPGTFCNASGLSQPTGPCSPGYYCTGGATQPKPTDGLTGNICPPGSYCGEGSREPELCPPGTFSPAAGLPSEFHCQICTPGFYCGAEGLLAPTGACDAGYWCPVGQTTRTAIPCPVEHHCPLGSAAPVPCPVGSYQDRDNQAVCKPCEAGYYCDGGFGLTNASSLRPCPKGHYCPPGTHLPDQYKCPPGTFNSKERMDSIDGCILCPPGKFCFAMGLSEPTGDCHAGFWCQKAARTPSPVAGPSGGPCPAGHYCPKGTLIPVPCPIGTWSNSTGHKSPEECQACPGGFYCGTDGLTVPMGPCSGGFYCLGKAESATPTDNISGGPCPKEHYCPVGTTQPLQCEPGTFMDTTQATQCWSCPAGMYCLAGTAHVCPAGFYCPENSGHDCKPCPKGTYSPDPGLTMASQCKECDGGHFCSLRNATAPSGLCSAGYYCTRGNTSPRPHPQGPGEGGACPAGHYCPRGTTDPQPCSEGTFNNLTKMGSQGDCLLCSPGHFCDMPGLSSPRGECWEGFYCQLGAVLPNAPVRDSRGGPCVPGHFCPKGAASPQPCPEGTISTQEGQASCSICSQGYYCPRNSSFYEGKECPAGHYCPPGTRVKFEYPCPAGTFNPYRGASSLQDCIACSPGHFCASGGLNAPSGSCSAGHFCRGGATSPTSEDSCPAGHYCPEGSASPKPCPPGRYSNTSGNVELSDCLPCPAGFSCEGLGLSSPSQPCQAGHYCPLGQRDGQPSSHPCSMGHMCPAGSATQIPCASGTYQDRPEQVECLPCPAGFFCAGLGSHTPITCPKGHYCPEGSSSGAAFPCPLGSLSTRVGLPSAAGCEPCPPGKYCSSMGLSAPTGDCSPGYLCTQGAVFPQPVGGATGGLCSPGFYCPKGTSHMLPCPPGTFNPLEGAASADACVPCLPGKYCAGSGLDSPSGLCWPGHYCMLGANSPAPNTTGISTHLSNYTADEFLLDQSRGDICPKGYYCPSGSSHPRPCPPGTFLGKYGAKSEVECDPCTPGFYCPEWGQGSADLKCPEGWYCPAGSGSSQQLDYQCDPGHACPSGSILPSPCPSGSYQPLPAQPTCSTCPPGFYCLEGSSEPVPCPLGTVGQTGGLESPLACSPCPPGTYCRVSGLSLPSGPCAAGHYCSLGATDPTPVSQSFGDLCPPGHFCPHGSSAPVPCPAGTYLSDSGAPSWTHCLPCPPGLYCSSSGSALPSGLCFPGYYCAGGASSATPLARTSHTGYLQDVTLSSSGTEHALRAWVYNETVLEGGASDRMSAATHRNATAAESSGFQGDICPRGFYCPRGSAQPQSCEQGLYCDRAGLFAPAGSCAAGYFCPRGSTDPQASLCPAGHYCPLGTSNPIPCPLGTLRSSPGGSAEDECLACPPGHFCAQRGLLSHSGLCAPGYHCPGGQLSARPPEHICRAGHHCGEGSPVERPCGPGSYQASEGQEACDVCPSGYFCPEEAMKQPIPCQKGFYCPKGTATQRPCPPGTYGNHFGMTKATDCTLCDPGMYCKGSGNTSPTGLCNAGFLCFGGSSLSAPSDGDMGGLCPAGFYCPAGSLAPSPCHRGSFSDQVGLSAPTQCRNCRPGFYCSEPGLTAVSGPCLPGYFCLEGSESATPMAGYCIAGHYCEGGSAIPKPCPLGTHRSEEGGKGREDCIPCHQDWFQDLEGQVKCKPCPPGYHCPVSAKDFEGVTTPLPCPTGHFCQTGLSPCPRGTYSSVHGLSSADECLLCPEGYFCGSAGLVQPSGTCAPGFLCLAGAQQPKPTDNHTGSPCPRGAYCLLGVIAGECSPGFFCDWGSSGPKRSLCPLGFYCPLGSKSPMPCLPGTFGLLPGNSHQEDCVICPAGSVCEGRGDQPTACPEGHFCPPGTAVGSSFPCPPGTTRTQPGAARLEDCQPCPSGMFCAHHGRAIPTGLCQAGYLCHSGASSPNATGHTVQSPGTNLCPPGHYCPAGTAYPMPCPPGSYSSSPGLKEVEQCQPCPPGHFCDHPALIHISEAALCDAGYVCLSGSSTPRPLDGLQGYLCPTGFSCPVGTAVEIPCEPGTYSLAPGAAHCLSCPAGTTCTSSGTQLPLPCPAGHYCPTGSSSPLPCPPGTMSQQTGAQDNSTCVPCPRSLYCSSRGTSEPQGQCQHGYFCQGGATSSTPQSSPSFPRNGPCPSGHYCPTGTLSPVPCPAGSFQNLTGTSSLESCLPCLPGHFCASLGQHSLSGPCSAGFYCPPGFSSISPEALLCPKGHYCPEGSAIPLPCPGGSYQPQPGAVNCTPCPPRFYCKEVSMEEPQPCPHHSYCPEATVVPVPCPNGTFTPMEFGGLQEEGECLLCPPGRFCRFGRVQGLCAAGYICISGSSEFAPQRLPLHNWSWCQDRVECSGACPAGSYCPEGALVPRACPANTIRVSPGGSSLQDCLACPPKHWCREGDPSLYLCPPGHYCDGLPGIDPQQGAGPKECPFFTYRSTPGAGNKGECHSCPAGFYCNSTGLLNFSSSPCPPGFWCSGKGPSVLCPAGTRRPQPGAATPDQCQPCTPGTYCPDPQVTSQPNIQGVPCRASFQCPRGAVMEMPCRAGSFCGPMTGEPTECPAGYFCPEGSDTYNKAQQLCTFPHYCPSNSSEEQLCDGGFRPLNTSGLRTSRDGSCTLCEAGMYRPGLSTEPHCLPCPSGYHCPPGTEHYWTHVCPPGYICPLSSATPAPCPPGSYGNSTKAENPGDCYPCPEGTFNYLPGQKACFPCGSSSFSLPGASSCTCIGQNRAFQHSDGSCLCKTGFVFYNNLDQRISDSDSTLDCQPEVNERCEAGQVRLASTRGCVNPSLHLCDITCGAHGGVLDVELGICQCERYVSAEELCNASCVLRLPRVSAHFAAGGQLLLRVRHSDERQDRSRILVDVLGPDVHVKAVGNVHFVQFASDGVFGWILTDKELIDTLLSEPVKYLHRGSTSNMDTNDNNNFVSSPLPRIPNPIVCLSPNDMLIFRLTVNYTNRHHSHFPVYQKDHLFNSNPTWDFGMFRRLSRLIRQSQFNTSWFAHTFFEPGKYIFLDNAFPDWSLVVVVNKLGMECDPTAAAFQPSTPALLVRHGVLWQRRLNLLPNWATIVGVLCFLILLIVVLTASVLFLESGRGRLAPLSVAKPRWRSLGEPRVPVGDCCVHQGHDILGYRGVGEGAETEEMLVCRGGWLELEEFNVKTLYDKLEDQSLHLASQLARFRKETQEFYKNIYQQTDALKDLMENMDADKLNQIKELLAFKGLGSEEVMDRGDRAKGEAIEVVGALLRAFGTLLRRDDVEGSLQDDLADAPLLDSGAHTRSTQDFHGPLQLSMTDMVSCKTVQDTRPLPLSSVHLPDSVTCLSDTDLAKLVALTPLSRTLQDIQESLLKLSHPEKDAVDRSVEELDGELIPWALDNLSPQHLAVFLFGCDIVRRLCSSCGFPRVTLLLAHAVPISRNPGLPGPCIRDFHYDPGNQILYLHRAKLENVGHFTATILHSMAYISSGSSQDFFQALYHAVSALGPALFHSSFFRGLDKVTQEEKAGTLFDDFLSLKVPIETHFTEPLLAERLQKFKHYKLLQHLRDLKPCMTKDGVEGMWEEKEEPGPAQGDVQAQMRSMEREIDRLDCLFLHLSACLQGGVEAKVWPEEQKQDGDKLPQATVNAARSPTRTLLLSLKRRCVAQRLSEMHHKLSQIKLSQIGPDQFGLGQQHSCEPGIMGQDGHFLMASGNEPDAQKVEQMDNQQQHFQTADSKEPDGQE